MSSKNPSSDPTLSQFKQNMVSDGYVLGEHSGRCCVGIQGLNYALEKAADILLNFFLDQSRSAIMSAAGNVVNSIF